MRPEVSFEISFGKGADSSALVVFEPDKERNLGADGKEKTRFAPGEDYFFRLHFDTRKLYPACDPIATHGDVETQGQDLRSIEQEFLWMVVEDKHTLTCIPYSPLTVRWYGKAGTGLRRVDLLTATITGGILPALGLVSYQAQYNLYRLITPKVELGADEIYPIRICSYMEGV